MKDLIQPTNSTIESSIIELQTTSYPVAYISSEDSLSIAISSDPMSFYLALDENAILFMDNIAMAFSKGFKLKDEINYV